MSVSSPRNAKGRRSAVALRERVSRPIPELKLLLETIYAKGAGYGFGFPTQLAGNLKDITEKQFSGFYGEAGNATSWLAIPSLARLVCGNGFRTRNLLSGKLDVFVNLPLNQVKLFLAILDRQESHARGMREKVANVESCVTGDQARFQCEP